MMDDVAQYQVGTDVTILAGILQDNLGVTSIPLRVLSTLESGHWCLLSDLLITEMTNTCPCLSLEPFSLLT
jgi:hypothetical protein